MGRGGVRVALADAWGRVLAERVQLPRLPDCAVAGIDGLAIRAAESEGGSDYAPVPVAGTMIAAGSPLPCPADAVLPPALFDAGPVALAGVARGSFVVPAGHDAAEGTALAAGTLLGALHLALLAQAEVGAVWVLERPRVLLAVAASSPNELVPMVTALVQAEGAMVVAGEADMVLRLGGDRAIWSDGLPAFRADGGELTLPGQALRCLVTFVLVVAPVLRGIAGRPEPERVGAVLARKVTSGLGQVDAVPVRVQAGVAVPLGPAEGCGLLAAAEANGLLMVPAQSEGYAEGASVTIIPVL